MKKLLPKFFGIYLNMLNRIFPSVAARQGFQLFCYPFKAQLTTRQQQFLQTSTRADIKISGKNVPLYRWGNGSKKCLLIHGWQSNSYRWRQYIEALDPSIYTIIAFDAPGHGNAEAKLSNVPLFIKTINTILESENKFYAFIGHSLGGFSSLYFCHLYPRLQPQKLVILGSPGRVLDFVNAFANTIGLSEHAKHNIKKYFVNYTGHEPEYFEVQNFMKTIEADGLIIHDEADTDASVKYGRLIHKMWKNSELWITKGFGHKLRDPQVTERVIDFLST